MSSIKSMPVKATPDMISAAYMLLETMPGGTPDRQKKIVAKVWETMAAFAPTQRPSGLTHRMAICLELITEYIAENGRSPTYEEIGNQMGKKRHDIAYIVHALARRGFLAVTPRSRRSIRLLPAPLPAVKTKR